MFGFLKRRGPDRPVVPFGDDVAAALKPPEPHWKATPTGSPGQFIHTFVGGQTDAQRKAAEDQAIAEFDRAMAADPRLPVTPQRQSPFSTTPNPASFPMP